MEKEKLKEEILKGIEICKNEITLYEDGVEIEANVEQIDFVINELNDILLSIENNSIPSKANRYQLTSMWNITHEWGWNIWNESDNMLSLIPKINKLYLEY